MTINVDPLPSWGLKSFVAITIQRVKDVFFYGFLVQFTQIWLKNKYRYVTNPLTAISAYIRKSEGHVQKD